MTPNTYDTILQVANRLFICQGYTATSIRQIAEETGIGKATVYHHFVDKQAIVLALIKKSMDGQQAMLDAIKAETDPRRRIQTAVTASIRFLFETMEIMQIARREVPDGRAEMQSQYMTFLHEFKVLMSDALRQGRRQGIFRAVDPAKVSHALMTIIQGTFAVAHTTGERPESPEQTAAFLLDIFFRGIEKH